MGGWVGGWVVDGAPCKSASQPASQPGSVLRMQVSGALPSQAVPTIACCACCACCAHRCLLRLLCPPLPFKLCPPLPAAPAVPTTACCACCAVLHPHRAHRQAVVAHRARDGHTQPPPRAPRPQLRPQVGVPPLPPLAVAAAGLLCCCRRRQSQALACPPACLPASHAALPFAAGINCNPPGAPTHLDPPPSPSPPHSHHMLRLHWQEPWRHPHHLGPHVWNLPGGAQGPEAHLRAQCPGECWWVLVGAGGCRWVLVGAGGWVGGRVGGVGEWCGLHRQEATQG